MINSNNDIININDDIITKGAAATGIETVWQQVVVMVPHFLTITSSVTIVTALANKSKATVYKWLPVLIDLANT